MIKRGQFAPLGAELVWMLIGIPLSVWLGVLWDAFQSPNGTQMFLGASNNFYLLWMAPVVLVGLVRIITRTACTRTSGQAVALGGLLVLAWAIGGLVYNGRFASLQDAVVPIVALFNLILALLGWILARHARAQGHGDALNGALACILLATGAGVLAAALVHILGPWPERQVFLYVDGFGNIRTLGETAMLALAAGIALLWARPHPLAFLATVLCAGLLAWSGTRAAWVGMGGMIALGLAVWRPGWTATGSTLLALVLGAGLSLLVPIPNANSSYGITRIGALAQETATVIERGIPAAEQAGEAQGSDRAQLWSWGASATAQAPFMGHGYGAMDSLERPHHARFKHLHNLPLDLSFGMGIPMGLALTLLLLWAVFSATFQARRDRLFLLPLCAGGVLATSLFAGLFLFPITVAVAAVGLSGAGLRR